MRRPAESSISKVTRIKPSSDKSPIRPFTTTLAFLPLSGHTEGQDATKGRLLLPLPRLPFDWNDARAGRRKTTFEVQVTYYLIRANVSLVLGDVFPKHTALVC